MYLNKEHLIECIYYGTKDVELKKKKLIKVKITLKELFSRKVSIPFLEMFITTKCNLKCRNCSNLIPTYKVNSSNIKIDDITKMVEKLLEKVDTIYRLKIHGGEVFLHPELKQIINYLDPIKKIKSIRLTTNGTIIPSDDIIKTIANSRVVVQISDYNIPNRKVEELITILKKNGVKFAYIQDQVWKDFGGHHKRDFNSYMFCSTRTCKSLIDGKIYICSRAAISEKLEYLINEDFIDININKEDFKKQFKKFYNIKSSKACDYCDGNTDYAKEIPAGIQE